MASKNKGYKMKRISSLLAIVALAVVTTGCAHSTRVGMGQAVVAYHVEAHEWETPSFTADLQSNPMTSELNTGLITLGSEIGTVDQPEWFSLNVVVEPPVSEQPE